MASAGEILISLGKAPILLPKKATTVCPPSIASLSMSPSGLATIAKGMVAKAP